MLIDLNADIGEGFASDDALLAHVSSASVACGGHAGDAATMARTCEHAVRHGVSIGAHVAYPDPAGFGRREVGLSAEAIAALVLEQIGELQAHALAAGGTVGFVKPHGALYHRSSRDGAVAEAIVGAVRIAGVGTSLLGAPDSALLQAAAEAGLAGVAEGFADRGYLRGGDLVSRDDDGAVLSPVQAAAQALELVGRQRVVAVDGHVLELAVGSLCVHGDAPEAAATVAAVADALARAGVTIRSFA
jgi:UPF0271 protein